MNLRVASVTGSLHTNKDQSNVVMERQAVTSALRCRQLTGLTLCTNAIQSWQSWLHVSNGILDDFITSNRQGIDDELAGQPFSQRHWMQLQLLQALTLIKVCQDLCISLWNLTNSVNAFRHVFTIADEEYSRPYFCQALPICNLMNESQMTFSWTNQLQNTGNSITISIIDSSCVYCIMCEC